MKFNLIQSVIGILILIHVFLFACPVYSEKEEYIWTKISGKWGIVEEEKKNYAAETRAIPNVWNYNELLNYNSIASINTIENYSSINFSIISVSPKAYPVELILFFSLKKYDKDPYKDFYAFKVKGDEKGFNKIIFISSEVKDKTKPQNEKNNFIVKELSFIETSLEYNKEYRVEIKFKKNKAMLLFDGKKLFEASAAESLTSGLIGFGGRGSELKLSDVRVYSGRKIVLQDDFSKDTIKIPKIIFKKVSKEEYEKANYNKK
jgi:hypothetical protein